VPNFDPTSQKSIAAFILESLPRHKQFLLSTVDEQAKPWGVCLNLTIDKEMRIIWKSRKDTELAQLIDIRFAKKGKVNPPINTFLGDAPDRIYCAELSEAWVNDDSHRKTSVDLAFLISTAIQLVSKLGS